MLAVYIMGSITILFGMALIAGVAYQMGRVSGLMDRK